ncbi:hypothetical protein [Candidatus Palauibacter polyketidifaciens]|uniref:YkvI family membrane protein n=1 Tax=Candidatus Palauibacter polyketidifaciens TaxID=3056740 RepID=UPI00139DBFF1|nr:hypothetical protein [Candidatus Palauibacter polyketidifaciens]MDE2719209.1 hypothetical protein [Candidatus Palauibacter polyketidifaciens]MYE33811.1 hypothetical protein [Gemmatimonadales bacterium]
MKAPWFRRYLLPGLVFQSAVIAGGYGTGRENVEFFLSIGPTPGLWAMALSTAIWSAVCAVTFELARQFRSYEYRNFFKRLLGPSWVLFEVTYVLLTLLVLAVIGAAAGSIVDETFGLPYALGVIVALGAVALLLFYGSVAIERFFAGWSFALYAVFVALVVWSLVRFGSTLGPSFTASGPNGDWLVKGVQYGGYNLSAAAVALFTVRHIQTRIQAVWAGLLAGVIGMLPAFFFYLAMVPHYPAIIDATVPSNFILEALGSRTFQIAYQVILFGTLIETGTGMIHAVNERLAVTRGERGAGMPSWARPVVAAVFLGIALSLTPLGLIDLIRQGYGTITWGFIVYYVLPVLTVGAWLAFRKRRGTGNAGTSGGGEGT